MFLRMFLIPCIYICSTQFKKYIKMKKDLLLIVLLLCSVSFVQAQTSLRVYQILQDNCVSCHNSASPAAGLDLQGSSASDMYDNVYEVTPSNSFAAAKGYDLIYPGRPDMSYAFRLIQDGFEPYIDMESGEMGATPHGDIAIGLTDVEKELVRQWILFGAPMNGEVVDETMLDTYYSGAGLETFPNGRPDAPDPSEGMQVKMGPFFIEAGSSEEIEYFQKHELFNDDDIEVTRVETMMNGNYSHHFILYDYNDASGAATQPHGLRPDINHLYVSIVKAIQDPTDLRLPQGAAFLWEAGKVLDLNSHYINYSNVPYKCEVYLNIYYQEPGLAEQEMKTRLLVNLDICIPNNGDPYAVEEPVTSPLGDIFLWAAGGHTHQLGTGYKMWKRENGVKTDLIYDASCWEGIPGCVSPYFDYQHIPIRYFEPFLPMTMNWNNGLIHEASWINDGPNEVCWGFTSQDEMMVMGIMYLEDTTGVTLVDVEDIPSPFDGTVLSPNPMSDWSVLTLPEDIGAIQVRLFDILGNEVMSLQNVRDSQIQLKRGNLPAGVYVYYLEDEAGNFHSGKIMME